MRTTLYAVYHKRCAINQAGSSLPEIGLLAQKCNIKPEQ